jgi:hypothetical protein
MMEAPTERRTPKIVYDEDAAAGARYRLLLVVAALLMICCSKLLLLVTKEEGLLTNHDRSLVLSIRTFLDYSGRATRKFFEQEQRASGGYY